MAQKITCCLVVRHYDEDEDRFVEEWHKDKLYSTQDEDLEVRKRDLKALAVDAVNYLLIPGNQLSLKTYVERDSSAITAADLGMS